MLYRHITVLIPVWCNWNTTLTKILSKNWFVLIPVWCNWNLLVWPVAAGAGGFNSCMVQLKLSPRRTGKSDSSCFNSCMVQLKSRKACMSLPNANVLIPVWCNWNPSWRSAYRCRGVVLIPVWCNWNFADQTSVAAMVQVLIPVWCNWNYQGYYTRNRWAVRFNSCMVQLKLVMGMTTSALVFVLIPVWCNWNLDYRALWGIQNSFNSCMVQLKSIALRLFFSNPKCFNSCMVQLKLC